MRNIIIFVALLGAAAIFTVLYCLIAAGSQAEKKLTEIMRKRKNRMKTNKDLIIEPNAAIEGRKYSEEKPWSCKYCYWWGGKKKGCSLKQCHYLLPEKKKAVKTTPCGGCPYGKHVPCIGYCIARLYSEMKGKKGRG